MCYLSREVEGGGLGNRTVHLAEHLAELRHHGGEVVEQRLHRLLEDGAHRLKGRRDQRRLENIVISDCEDR